MITLVKTHRGSWNPDSPRFGPDETSVRWDCDGTCGLVGLEWDDTPYRADGIPHEDPSEGQAAYCETCAARMHPDDTDDN